MEVDAVVEPAIGQIDEVAASNLWDQGKRENAGSDDDHAFHSQNIRIEQ